MPRIRELAIMSLRLLKFASNEASSDDPAAGNSGWAIIPPSPPNFSKLVGEVGSQNRIHRHVRPFAPRISSVASSKQRPWPDVMMKSASSQKRAGCRCLSCYQGVLSSSCRK
ncbi:hypothetical protein RJZ56_005937 [Blastomyces dermatitidis]